MNLEKDILPQGQFTKKQHAFLRKYDALIAGLATIAAVIALYAVPHGAYYYGGTYGDTIETYITLAIVVAVLTLLAGSIFLLVRANGDKHSDKPMFPSLPFKLSLLSLVAIWVIAAPWVFMHLADEVPFVHLLFAVPATLFLGVLFGAIAWCLVAVPLALLARAVHGLVIKKDPTMLVPLTLSVAMLLLASLIAIMPTAIDLDIPGKVGAMAGVMALLGFSNGNYTIENEAAFMLGRGVLIAAIVLLVAHGVLKARFKNK